MKRFLLLLGLYMQGAAVQFAGFIPALVAFHLLGTFVYHRIETWLPGCAIAIGITALLWLWILRRTEEPPQRTLVTLSLYTLLWLVFLIGAFLLSLIIRQRDLVSPRDLVIFLLSVVAFIYLKRVLSRRDAAAEGLVRGKSKT